MAPSSLAPSSPLSVLSESMFQDQTVSPARSASSNGMLRAASRTPSPQPPEKALHDRGTSPQDLPPSPSAKVIEQIAFEPQSESPGMDAKGDKQLSPHPSSPPVTDALPGTDEPGQTTPEPSRAIIQPRRSSRTPRPRSKTFSPAPSPPSPPAANTSKKRKAPTPVTTKKITLTNKKRKAANAKWLAPVVYTDPKSPLVTADLRAILLHPMAWDCLEDEERREIVGMLGLSLPEDGGGEGEKKLPRPDLSYLLNRDGFRTDCRRYQEAIEAEQFDEGWLREAWIAHERRRRGDFRVFLEGKLERDWGVRVPEEEVEGARGGEADGAEAEEGGEDVSPNGAEMKSVSAGERSRETSGSHSTVSTVGERRFTGLKLGLNDGVDGDAEQTNDDNVAAV